MYKNIIKTYFMFYCCIIVVLNYFLYFSVTKLFFFKCRYIKYVFRKGINNCFKVYDQIKLIFLIQVTKLVKRLGCNKKKESMC